MNTQPTRGAAGFTLIEMLLALVIAAILFSAVFMSLGTVVDSRAEMANRATPYTVGPAILDAISTDLENAYFYDYTDNNVFYGVDSELNGRPADALSFLSCTRTFAPQRFGDAEDLRHSFVNEVAYVLRRGPSPFLELWRRESFHVDDEPHAGGDYILLYDKINSFDVRYVSRNPTASESSGLSGTQEKTEDEMLVDSWNAVQEQGVPRALQITVSLFAPDTLATVAEALAEGSARTYEFKRFVTLPQVHMSLDTERAIAGWDGKFQEGSAGGGAGGGTGGPQAGVGGAGGGRGGRGGRGGDRPGQGGPGGNRPPGQGNRPPGGQGGANNPFLQALQGRGRPAPASGANPFGALFGGGGR